MQATNILQRLIIGTIVLFCSFMVTAEAEKTTTTQLRELKKEVLALNRDLFILEEELLFPASTQVAVFVSMDVGEFFQLDAVELKLNDKTVAHYLYTDRQAKALFKGGVHRLYVGNVKSGDHELTAFFNGVGPHGRDYRRGTTISFEKDTDSKNIELKINDSVAKLQPEFSVKEW